MFSRPVLTALATAAVLAAGAGPAAANPLQVPEGSAGPHTVDVPVSPLAPSLVVRKIDVTASDGTAIAGQDFDALSPTLQVSLAPFQLSASVPVVIHGDTLPEGDETFTLHGAGLADQQVVIVDDDPATVVSNGPAPAAIPAGDPAPSPAPAPPPQQQSRGMVGDAVYVADPSVRYLGLTEKTHRVRLRLTCPKAFDCPGAVSLRWVGRKAGGASFLLHKGTQRVVTVRLSAKAWRSLRRHHRLRLVAQLDSGRTARFTVKR